MSVDGVPIIGLTPLANLFVNTGHGHLGWTMAASSARLLTDLITGAKPILDPAPYALGRF
jgi:D-amino-acid dehydrogenase